MRPKRKIASVGVLALVVVLELAAIGFAPPAAAFIVNTSGLQQSVWANHPSNAFYAVDPGLSNRLSVGVSPGNYQQGVLVKTTGTIQQAANRWNSASAFHYTHAPQCLQSSE